MEFVEVPLFDEDIFKMLVRFAINLTFLTITVRYLYYRYAYNKDYLFSFSMVNIVAFFICFALKKFDLEIGMALGLFAIFGIVRYRTDAIPIKEMTYLFVVIGFAVLNALTNKKMSYVELLFANGAIVIGLALLEKYWFVKSERSKDVVLEEIDLIKPENYQALKENLESRTGLQLSRIEVGKVDFLRDVANVIVYYHPSEQNGILGEDLKGEI